MKAEVINEQPHTWKDIVRPLIPRGLLNARNAYKDRQALAYFSGLSHKDFAAGKCPAGINLYGDSAAGTGLSRSVQLLREAFAEVGIPYSFHHIEEWSGCFLHAEEEKGQTDYGVNLFHLQPSVWLSFLKQFDRRQLDEHYNIAFWLWETPELPKEWHKVCDFFDEIWVPSAFIARAIRKVTDKPVKVMYYGLSREGEQLPDGMAARRRLGVPESDLLCLVLYDGRSSIERKNPYGALEAFHKAFPTVPENVWLVIKGKGFTKQEKKQLERRLRGIPNVLWVEGLLPWQEVQELLAAADVLLSLHRAEGFGLPVAEVMKYGGVAVATDYSSTREFLDAGCGCPVRYRLLRTKRDISLYRKGTIWADPDTEDAARQLRRLYEEPGLRQQLGQAAQARVRGMLDLKRSGERMKHRLRVIVGSQEG
ncbi:MAG: glycosyltransferase family 4 protein [Lachnospiraceae bacterium]|nr:glycosyltransferase family 4 protein [Lachnospiraceae bacterium]